jgi:3-phenylpropionate/cinnamic acid dioxygenase small subunit
MIDLCDELSALYSHYALGIDGADFEMVLGCFASDATFEVVGAYVAHGRDMIGERLRSRHRTGCTHLTSNAMFEQIDDGAVRGRASFAVLDDHAAPISCGAYDDRITRSSDGKWEFMSRRIHYRGVAEPLCAISGRDS